VGCDAISVAAAAPSGGRAMSYGVGIVCITLVVGDFPVLSVSSSMCNERRTIKCVQSPASAVV